MAGTTVSADVTGMQGSDVLQVRLELNRLIDDLEAVRAGLAATSTAVNAVITAAATNIAAVAAVTPVTRTTFDTAGDLTAAKVADLNGNTTI